jgi:hypothetical protein
VPDAIALPLSYLGALDAHRAEIPLERLPHYRASLRIRHDNRIRVSLRGNDRHEVHRFRAFPAAHRSRDQTRDDARSQVRTNIPEGFFLIEPDPRFEFRHRHRFEFGQRAAEREREPVTESQFRR